MIAALAWIVSPAPAQQSDSPESDERESFTLDTLGEPTDRTGNRLVAELMENLRVTLDLYTRASFSDKPGGSFYSGAAGLDVHKVFSNARGDWGTAVLQVYLTRLEDQEMRPSHFEDEDDTDLVFRIFNFNYTGFRGDAFNIRVGHFELPYGLEHIINTNGTLRQYSPRQNLGQKLGWGATINGILPSFNYEVGYTYGDEQEFDSDDGHYTVSGRIGSPRDENLEFGLSAFYGSDLETADTRYRVGLDGQIHYGLWSTLGELSVGADEAPDMSIVNLLLEENWHSPGETVLIYGQVRTSLADPDGAKAEDAFGYAAGVRWAPDNHWAYSLQLSQDVSTIGSAAHGAVFSLQARYRF